MQLRRYTDGDLGLTEALETDPRVMNELGGPIDRARVPALHGRRVGEPWWFTIVPGPEPTAVGTIGIWEHEFDGESIFETGWMLLPAFQGRGLGSAALGMLIERARAASAFDHLHAFPAVTNLPSNALCRKFGFTLLGPRTFEFRESMLHCNHWRLAL
jgi:RimJ/RimL family protein N-acetyltransferase